MATTLPDAPCRGLTGAGLGREHAAYELGWEMGPKRPKRPAAYEPGWEMRTRTRTRPAPASDEAGLQLPGEDLAGRVARHLLG